MSTLSSSPPSPNQTTTTNSSPAEQSSSPSQPASLDTRATTSSSSTGATASVDTASLRAFLSKYVSVADPGITPATQPLSNSSVQPSTTPSLHARHESSGQNLSQGTAAHTTARQIPTGITPSSNPAGSVALSGASLADSPSSSWNTDKAASGPTRTSESSKSQPNESTAATASQAPSHEKGPGYGYGPTNKAATPSEVVSSDISNKNIGVALDQALDKLMSSRGAGPPGSTATESSLSSPTNIASGASYPSQATSLERSPGVINPDAGNGHPSPQTLQSDLVPQTTSPAAPEHSQALTLAAQQRAVAAEATQHLEHSQAERAAQIRVIQQIYAAERAPSPSPALSGNAPEQIVNSQPRHESTTIAVEKLRQSVLDKCIAIETQIETYATERQRITPANSSADSLIQGRSNAIKLEPIRHDSAPSLELRHADRGNNNQALYRSIVQGSSPFLAPGANPGLGSLRNPLAERAHAPLTALSGLFKKLQAFSRRSTNVQLMNRMDSALERSCLALATGAAIGVVGIELLLKTTNQALLSLLRLAKASSRSELDYEQQALENSLTTELERYLVHDALEPSDRSIVADVSGILVDQSSQLPIANVLVGSRELGSTMTDSQGIFLFANVKVGTHYSLAFYKPFFALDPATISSKCGFESHHSIQVTLTIIDPASTT